MHKLIIIIKHHCAQELRTKYKTAHTIERRHFILIVLTALGETLQHSTSIKQKVEQVICVRGDFLSHLFS